MAISQSSNEGRTDCTTAETWLCPRWKICSGQVHSGTVSFFWHEPEDFKSTSGVDASVFPLDDKGKKASDRHHSFGQFIPEHQSGPPHLIRNFRITRCDVFERPLEVHSITITSATTGTTFYSQNRVHLLSSGVYGVSTRLLGELDSLAAALPQAMIKSINTPHGEITEELEQDKIFQFAQQFDPSRVIYNGLVPFLVAVIEHYFRECFEILLKYDPSALARLDEQNRRISIAEARAIARGESGFEQIVSAWYSFQNVTGIERAYKEILGIDVGKTLGHQERIREKLVVMSKSLDDLIKKRHGVVHHFFLDRDLDQDEFLDLLHFVKTLLSAGG